MASGGFRMTVTVLLTIMLTAGVGGPTRRTAPTRVRPGCRPASISAGTSGQQTPPEKKEGTETKKPTDEEARQAEVDAALAKFSEEMVVTAQLREEKAQDVPISLTAISGATLEKIGLQGIEDLPDAVPGLNIVNIAPGSNAFAARGVTNLGGSIETNAVVGYYVDEVPISASGQGPDFALWDVERVEVLRGPQGTLFGEGSMAGTMRIITNKPDITRFSARVNATPSSTAEGGASGRLRAMVNVPLVENKLALRVLAGYIDNAGWIDVPDLAEDDANTQEQFDVRVAARWLPSDKWIVDASYMRQKLDLGTEFTATSPWTLYPQEQIPSAGPVGYLGTTDTINENANVSLTYDLGWASLISATSYFDYTSDWVIDLTPFVPLFFGPTTGGTAKNPPHATSTLWTEEIRLASGATSKVHWTVGAFYKSSDRLDERNFQFYLEHAFGVPGFNLTDISSSREKSQATSYSLFGEADFALASNVSMQVGLRYYADDRDYTNEQLTSSVIFGTQAGPFIRGPARTPTSPRRCRCAGSRATASCCLPRLRRASRAAGPTPTPISAISCPRTTPPRSYGSTRSAARRISPPPGWPTPPSTTTTGPTCSSGSSRPTGCSRSPRMPAPPRRSAVSWRLRGLLPLDGLGVSLNVAYTDAEITEQVENAVGGVVAEKGNKIPITSEWTTGLAFDYSRPLSAALTGMARASWSHRAPHLLGANNVEYQKNDVYDLVGLSLGVSAGGWSLEAYADNLLNDASSTFKYNRVVAVPLTYISYVRPGRSGSGST